MCTGKDGEGFNLLNPLAIGKTSEAIDSVKSGDPTKSFSGSPIADLFENRRKLNEIINNMDR
tara:strand:+ start:670 stop:855 length:186 start_codon:yes stop_codon:yes gene_type:complete